MKTALKSSFCTYKTILFYISTADLKFKRKKNITASDLIYDRTVATQFKKCINIENMFDFWQLFLIVALMSIVNRSGSFNNYKIVETTNGKIRGILNTTLLNAIPFYSFRGVPYAKPPIGDLRFKVHKYTRLKSIFPLILIYQ